jgi:hypothetical protein
MSFIPRGDDDDSGTSMIDVPDMSEVIANAGNLAVPGQPETFTLRMLYEEFPELGAKLTPRIVQSIIDMAADVIAESRWGSKWRVAFALYVAHYVTLRDRASRDSDPSALVQSESADGGSVSYNHQLTVGNNSNWGQFNSTTYGAMFVTEARLLGLGGAFIS